MKYRGLALAAAVGLIVVACSGDDATTGSNATGGASSGAAGKAGASTQGTSGDANGGTSAPGNPGGGVGGEGAGAGGLGAAGRKSAGAAGDTDAAGGTGGSPLQTDPEPPGGAGAGGAGCVPGVIPMPFEVEPVDIIFVIDNSPSMAPAVAQLSAGLNAFAAQLAAKKLDYKLIALSVRAKTNPVNIDGSARYGICVPPPLAGDDNCGNGPRFFQSDVNVTSAAARPGRSSCGRAPAATSSSSPTTTRGCRRMTSRTLPGAPTLSTATSRCRRACSPPTARSRTSCSTACTAGARSMIPTLRAPTRTSRSLLQGPFTPSLS